MTEDEARAWIAETYGRDKAAALSVFVDVLIQANQSQNLIGKSSEEHIWNRHILDSAQLCRWVHKPGRWLDIGSGAGLPGIVVALLTEQAMTLVEPRRKRVEFLQKVAGSLQLKNVTIQQSEIERLHDQPFDIITARAFTSLRALFSSAIHLATQSTVWILPKGRSAEQELAGAREAWQGVFHVEQSLTDDDAGVIVATGVTPR